MPTASGVAVVPEGGRHTRKTAEVLVKNLVHARTTLFVSRMHNVRFALKVAGNMQLNTERAHLAIDIETLVSTSVQAMFNDHAATAFNKGENLDQAMQGILTDILGVASAAGVAPTPTGAALDNLVD